MRAARKDGRPTVAAPPPLEQENPTWPRACFAIDPRQLIELKLFARDRGFRTRADALRWLVNDALKRHVRPAG